MTKSYWGSNGVKAPIHQLKNASSFAELALNYFDNGVVLPYTRAEYHALPKDQQKEVKLIAYVTSCSFKQGSTRRSDSNADKIQLVILDIDNPFEARDIIDSKEVIRDQMGDLNFLIHTTISHTEESPRLRVVVSVAESELNTRRALSRHVANLLGITRHTHDNEGNLIDLTLGYDSCSVVTSQAFFRPVVFKDDDEGAVIVSRTSGVDLTVADLPADVFEEIVPEYSYLGGNTDWEDSIEDLPIPNFKLEWLEQALDKLDPDAPDKSGNSYIPWLFVICGCRHQFRIEEEAERAFEIFNEWSARGAKYSGREATYRKWRSINPQPRGRRPITIRTPLKRAIKAGWDYSDMAGEIQLDFEEWLDQTNDKIVLAKEGLARIAATPFKDENEIIQNDMLARLQKKMKSMGLSGMTASELKKQLKREKNIAAPKELKDDRPTWLQPWCYIAPDNLFFNTHNKLSLSPVSFDNTYNREMMKMVPDGQPNPTGRPLVNAKDFALNVKEVSILDGVMYDPSFAGDTTFMRFEGRNYVNTYRPPTVVGDPTKSVEAGTKFYNHLLWMVREPWIVEHLIQIMAYSVQFPQNKIRHMALIQSVAGIGKTLMAEILTNAYGNHNTAVISGKKINGKFNGFFSSVHLAILEEIRVSGLSRFEVMDALKEVITNEIVTVEEKYKNPTKIINKIFMLGFTNHRDAIALEPHDRRFFCIESHLTEAEVMARSEAGYFDEIALLREPATAENNFEGLAEGFVHFLNHVDCSNFDPNMRAPHTEYRQELIESSENPLKTEIVEIIEDPKHSLVDSDIIALGALRSLCSQNTHAKTIGVYLHELGYRPYRQYDTKLFSVNGLRTTVWTNPNTFMEEFGDPVEILRERAEEISLRGFED